MQQHVCVSRGGVGGYVCVCVCARARMYLHTYVYTTGRVLASPLARALAREAGLDLSAANATGPHGRIIAADVLTAIESGAVGATAGAPAGEALSY